MARKVAYLGYLIQSRPEFNQKWQKWQIRIFVSREGAAGVRTRKFVSDVLYASEYEADTHGITYGLRVIDGRVEGQSVADMESPNRRLTPRLRVQFQTSFASIEKVEGTGVILDLSLDGCRIESSDLMKVGTALELHIHVPSWECPVVVEAATVQWVSAPMFGLAFFRLTETERARLNAVIVALENPIH